MNTATIKFKGKGRQSFNLVQCAKLDMGPALDGVIRGVVVRNARVNGKPINLNVRGTVQEGIGGEYTYSNGPTPVLKLSVHCQQATVVFTPLSSFIDQDIEVDIEVGVSTKANRA